MKINKLLLSVAVSTALFSTAVLAQNEEEKNDSMEIEEVLVTAQKRSETLNEVPIAISVFGAENIDQTGVQELRELGDYIPNLTVTQGTDFGAKIVIRGVGANARNIGFDSRVGVYLDGVYLGQGPALNQDLVDLDHIEVLRGPQGTLFGKNTVAGAISMISKKPGPDFEGNVSVNLANYDGVEIKANVNIPLSETVSARLYLSDRTRDGFVKNVYDQSHVPTTANIVHPLAGPLFGLPLCSTAGGSSPAGCIANVPGPDSAPDTSKLINNQDTQSYRAQLRIQPNEMLDINIAVDGLDSFRDSLNGEPLTDTFGSTLDRFAPEQYEVSLSTRGWEKRDIFGANLNIDYGMDNGYTIRSITASRETKIHYINDTDNSAIDFLYIDYRDEYKQNTQEIQLISPDDAAFKYVVGMYYFNQDSYSGRDAITGNGGWIFGLPPGAGAFSDGTVETDSLAFFLNGSYDMSEQMTLGFGVRYSDETKDVDWNLDGARSGVFGIGSTGAANLVDSKTDTNVSPMVSIGYAIDEDTNVYAKYSSGFKSGGFNLDYVTQVDLDAGISFDKETVDSFEIGLKAKMIDGRLSLNAAAFIANYDDYQVNQFFDLGFDEASGTQLTSIRITNAAKVDTSGLELEAIFNVSADLSINASVGFLDATFNDFPGGTSVEVADPTSSNGVRKDPVNAAGKRLPLAAEFNASLGIQYYKRVDALDADLLVRFDVSHSGDYYTTIENEETRELTGLHGAIFTFDIANYGVPTTIDYGHVDAYTTLSGRIGLIDAGGAWDVYLWGRNLTDENENIDYFRDFFGSLSAQPMIPRTYGIEASYHF